MSMNTSSLQYRFANPSYKELTVFGIVMTPIVCLGIWSCSFSWIPPMEFILLGLLALGVIAAILAMRLDNHLPARFHKYAWTLVGLLASFWMLWYPVRSLLLAESKSRGEMLSDRIEQFRNEKGTCPASLDDPYFDGLPKWSAIGTKFSCSMEGECSVSFAGFGGCWWAYNSDRKEWYSFD